MNSPNNWFQRKSIIDDVVVVKREQAVLKKEFSSTFLHELEEWFEKCNLKPKEKKEFLLSKEKLYLDLLQLIQSQKKFKNSDLIQNQICSLAIFDLESNLLGRIININMQNLTVEFITLSGKNNNQIEIKKLSKVEFFDPFTAAMKAYYEKQKMIYDCYNYKETFVLLTGKEKKDNKTIEENNIDHYSLGRGIPLDKRIQERINNIDLRDNK